MKQKPYCNNFNENLKKKKWSTSPKIFKYKKKNRECLELPEYGMVIFVVLPGKDTDVDYNKSLIY